MTKSMFERKTAATTDATGLGQDQRWMRRALDLAAQSVGLASPNPMVGCVLVRDGNLVGEGWHDYGKRDHAEIAALKAAGNRSRGATAYTTLEPCSRTGRTGPCADALIAAGVERVVVATRDPNPAERNAQGGGRGIERLESAGVRVETGVLQEEARRLNDAFARRIRSGLPLVTLKIAATLDGRIAPAHPLTQAPYRITGDEAHAEVQKMRHASDALMTGVGTIIADNPRMTDRSGLQRRSPLLRVVLDSHLRTPLNSRIVETAKDDLLILYTQASAETEHALESRGIRLHQLEAAPGSRGADSHVSLAAAIQFLGSIGVNSVMIEGGAHINSAVLEWNLADRLTIFYGPMILGSDAIPMIESKLKPFHLPGADIRRCGQDFVVASLLRDPWSGME